MFPLAFKVCGAIITLKKFKGKKNQSFFFKNLRFCYDNYHPKRHIRYKRIDFASCNKRIMANKLLSTNLGQFGTISKTD